MLNFVKIVYRDLMEVVLWINLFGCSIAGGVIGFGYRSGENYAILGVLIGIFVGILSNILVGGLIATFLSMDEKLQHMDEKLQRLTASANNNTADSNSNASTVTANTVKNEADTAKIPSVNSGGDSNKNTVNEQVRNNYRIWWGPDGSKDESWIDADGVRHVNSYLPNSKLKGDAK